ncbi:DUF3140 domain-containing protein [Amycolatopsis oliviviridis]
MSEDFRIAVNMTPAELDKWLNIDESRSAYRHLVAEEEG